MRRLKKKREAGKQTTRTVRLLESEMDPIALLEAKRAEADENPAAIDDVCFAIRRLSEIEPDQLGLPDGKEGVLIDLRHKADAVESTHDPATIKDLLMALDAFLGEELQERPGDEGHGGSVLNPEGGGGVGRPGDEAPERMPERMARPEARAEPRPEAMPASRPESRPEMRPEERSSELSPRGGEPGSGEEGLERRRAAAAADGFMRYAARPAEPAEKEENMNMGYPSMESMQCEACGHPNRLPGGGGGMGMEKKEGEKPNAESAEAKLAEKLAEANRENETLKAKLTEAEKPKAEPETVKLTETDRAELFQLRAEKTLAEKTAKAIGAIKEAGLDGIVEPEKLVAFKESQWPLMIEAIERGGAIRTYGTEEPAPPVQARPRRQRESMESAADYFERSYDGTLASEF